MQDRVLLIQGLEHVNRAPYYFSQAMPLPSFTHPGLTLGSISSYSPGPGTHIYGTSICASLRGKPSISESNSLKPTISVILPSPVNTIPSRNITSRNILPFVNAIVLARVTRLQQRQVNVFILVVDDIVCADAFVGVVRKEDVRGWEVDKVKIEEMFRVGDTVRAVVVRISLELSVFRPITTNLNIDLAR